MHVRKVKDALASKLVIAAAFFSGILVFIIAFELYWRSRQILEAKSFGDLLLGSIWLPFQNEFGFYPFILGTLYVTLLAMVFAVPLSILSAIYLAEYARNEVRGVVKPLIDLLAGIPSVVYGVFGLLAVVPIIAKTAPIFGSFSTGYSLLAGGIVLAIMVFPIFRTI